jgi:predicted Zn finger-like uncharacterized protein
MISFSCPGCRTPFSVPDDQAGRKAKCDRCGARMVIPFADPGQPGHPPPDDTAERAKTRLDRGDPEDAEPPAPPEPVRLPAALEPDPPKCFQDTRTAGDLLEWLGYGVCVVGAVSCLIGVVVATVNNQMSAAIATFVVGVFCVVGIVVLNLAIGTTRVLVDIAESLRALRRRG